MIFLPVVERELRAAAKRPMTYYFRCIAAGIAFVVALGPLFGAFFGGISPVNVGHYVLFSLGVIGYLYASCEGVLITCDCLTEEKREGTIGLLFLTDLRGYDVVLGKMAARSWHAFGAILAGMPALALAFLIGGVTFGDFFRLIAALLSVLLFFASVGIFFSACCRSGRASLLASFLTIALTWVALPAAAYRGGSFLLVLLQAVSVLLSLPNVMFTAALAGFDPTVAAQTAKLTWINSFGLTFVLTNLLSLGLLTGASWVLPRAWQDKAASESRPRLRERLGATLGLDKFDHLVQPRTISESLLSVSPSLWMAERRLGAGFAAWGIFQIILLVAIWWFARRSPEGTGILLGTAVLVWHYSLKFSVALKASRGLAEDRRTGGLELLLTTGLDVDEIVRGHLLALKRQFLLPTLTVLAADAALVLALSFFQSIWQTVAMAAGIAAFAFVQLTDMYALAWVGLWHGLKQATATAAVRRVMVHALLGQFLTHFGTFLLYLTLFLGGTRAPPQQTTAQVIVTILFLLSGVAVNLSYCCEAYTRLHDLFRSTVAESMAPRTPRQREWLFRRLLKRFSRPPARSASAG